MPWVVLHAGPRVGVVNLLRAGGLEAWPHWILGTVGGDFGVGFRPTNTVSVQVRYTPSLYNAALDGSVGTELSHKLAVGVEIGF